MARGARCSRPVAEQGTMESKNKCFAARIVLVWTVEWRECQCGLWSAVAFDGVDRVWRAGKMDEKAGRCVVRR